MIEKELADTLVELRASIALGHDYVPARDLEHALQHHLDREMELRATIARISAEVTPITSRTERAGSGG